MMRCTLRSALVLFSAIFATVARGDDGDLPPNGPETDSCCGYGPDCCHDNVVLSFPDASVVIYDDSCPSGGLWCDPNGVSCCRWCSYDCSAVDGACFPCSDLGRDGGGDYDDHDDDDDGPGGGPPPPRGPQG
ncbi:unnamed protein product, partial [Phaeothamnion confervicola]